MKNKIYTFIATVIIVFSHAQTKYFSGETFDVNMKAEKGMKTAISDDYSVYLFSVISEGPVGTNKMIARKFDQKGNLTNVITQDFGKTPGTLSNYLGSTEVGPNQFVVFTEEYNGKANKKEIFQYLFNRKDDQFIQTQLAVYPIESAMKAGNAFVEFSENGRYAAIINDRFSNKKNPNTIDNIVLDLTTMKKKWEKEVTFDSEFNEREFAVTNSGKIVAFRKANSWKGAHKVALYSADSQQEFQLEDKLILSSIHPFTINDNDYLISFGYFDVTRVDQGNNNYAVFMNLQDGKTRASKVPEFSAIEINDIVPVSFSQKKDKISIFLDLQKKFKPKESPGNMFPDPVYYYGEPYLMTMSTDGEVKAVGKFGSEFNNGGLGFFTNDDKIYLATNNSLGKYSLFKYDSAANPWPVKSGEFGTTAEQIKYPMRIRTGSLSELIYFVPGVNRLIGFSVENNKMKMVNIYNLVQ